jgi:hypothetical protein
MGILDVTVTASSHFFLVLRRLLLVLVLILTGIFGKPGPTKRLIIASDLSFVGGGPKYMASAAADVPAGAPDCTSVAYRRAETARRDVEAETEAARAGRRSAWTAVRESIVLCVGCRGEVKG